MVNKQNLEEAGRRSQLYTAGRSQEEPHRAAFITRHGRSQQAATVVFECAQLVLLAYG